MERTQGSTHNNHLLAQSAQEARPSRQSRPRKAPGCKGPRKLNHRKESEFEGSFGSCRQVRSPFRTWLACTLQTLFPAKSLLHHACTATTPLPWSKTSGPPTQIPGGESERALRLSQRAAAASPGLPQVQQLVALVLGAEGGEAGVRAASHVVLRKETSLPISLPLPPSPSLPLPPSLPPYLSFSPPPPPFPLPSLPSALSSPSPMGTESTVQNAQRKMRIPVSFDPSQLIRAL